MTKVSISRSVELAMGHRLRFHKGKCRNYHGHNYNITFYVEGPVDEKTGMVMDFAELKGIIFSVLEPFDHAMCLHEDDELVSILTDLGSKVVTLAVEPTAENLCAHWKERFLFSLPMHGYLSEKKYTGSVTVAETSDTSTVVV